MITIVYTSLVYERVRSWGLLGIEITIISSGHVELWVEEVMVAIVIIV